MVGPHRSQDKNVIENVQIESSRLATRLSDLGQKTASGFFLTSNFHLIGLRSLSTIDNSYTGTLKEFTRKYYEIRNESNSKLSDQYKCLYKFQNVLQNVNR